MDVLLIPFSLVWTGFAVAWLSLVLTSVPGAAVIPFAAVGAVLVVFGFYLVLGRFLLKWSRMRRTRYALTDHRAIVDRDGDRREVELRGVAVHAKTRNRSAHIEVRFSRAGDFWHLVRALNSRMYANSGLDFFAPWDDVAFYDVADVAGLRAAQSTRYGAAESRR